MNNTNGGGMSSGHTPFAGSNSKHFGTHLVTVMLTLLMMVMGSANVWADESGTMTVTWSMAGSTNKSGVASVDDVVDVSDAAIVSPTYLQEGANQSASFTDFTGTMYGVNVKENLGNNETISEDDYVVFRITVSDGCTFRPTGAVAKVARFGTDNGCARLSIFKTTDTEEKVVSEVSQPNRSGKGLEVSSYSVSWTETDEYEGGTVIEVRVNIGGNAASKNLGIADVVLTGEYTKGEVTKYDFTTSVSPTGTGHINQSPAGTAFVENRTISLVAVPEYGYSFDHWENGSGVTVSSTAAYSPVTIAGPSTYTAFFTPLSTYALNVAVSPLGTGTVSKNVDRPAYVSGDNVTLTATANKGYKFVSWTNSSNVEVSTNPSYVYTTTGSDASLTANFFALNAVTFTSGNDASIQGTMPETLYFDNGNTVQIPVNHSVYKEGYTLTGWSDGSNTYNVGTAALFSGNVTLTPVFTANTKSIDSRESAVEILLDLQRNNGAPLLDVGSNVEGIYVVQASIDGVTTDIKVGYNTKTGKIANGSWGDWCQLNGGVEFYLPSCSGATVSMERYGTTSASNSNTVTTVGGVAFPYDTKTPSLTVTSTDNPITVVYGSQDSYFRWIKFTLPAPNTSDLAIVSGHETVEAIKGETYSLTKGTDYTTSSNGVMSYSSDNTNVATVDPTTGVITGVSTGTATITLSQGRDGSYLAGGITLTVRVTNEVPDPAVTADLFSTYTVGKSQTKNLTFGVSHASQYQWYTCTDADKTGATAIENATNSSYAFSSDVAGTYYIYCVANNSVDVSVTSTVAAITVGATAQHTFDFTNWSATTLANLDADEANWDEFEKATHDATANTYNKAWYRHTAISTESILTANSENIAETYPLKFFAEAHNLGLAFDLGTALTDYAGSKYIWFMNTNSYFVIPRVKAGSTIIMGVETHKHGDARGVTVSYSNGTSESYTTTEYSDKSFTVPSAVALGAEYTDVKVQCAVKGSHVYYVDAELDPLDVKTSTVAINAGKTYTITSGMDFTTESTGAVSYATSDPSVCTVSSDGVITAVANGSAVVTVYQEANGVWAETAKQIAVTVSPVGTLTVKTPELTIVQGGTVTLTADTHYTSNNTADVASATSTNTSVATVTPAGVITAVAAGTTTINFTLGADANYAGGTGSITLTVKALPNGVTFQTIPGSIDLGNGEHPVSSAGNYSRPENNNTNIGYVKSDTRDLWYVNNTTAGLLKMNVGISKYNAHEMIVTVTDLETGFVEAQGVIDNVQNYSNYAPATLSIGLVTTGRKMIEIKPDEYDTGGGWGYNYNNLSFSILPAPTFTRNLGSLYSTVPGVATTLSVTAVDDITSYQWYSCADANGNGAAPISGANTSSYAYSNSVEGDYYFFCEATNVVGTTRSNIANVHVGTTKTFDFKNWDSSDLVISPTTTKNGKVSRIDSGDTNDIYEVDYPYSFRGYIGVLNGDVAISNTYGLTNNKSNASRGAAVLELKSGDEVIFTGTGLTADMFNSTTDDNRGTCDVVVNDDGTRATITMTSAGNLAFSILKDHTQNIYTITVPFKTTPNITLDLDESYEATSGESKTLTLQADGENLSYQWYYNGTTNSNKGGEAIAGANSDSYTINPVTQTGVYYCLVTNTQTKTCVASVAEKIIINPIITFQCDEMEGIAQNGTVLGRVPYGSAASPSVGTKQLESGESIIIPDNQTLLKPDYTLAYWTPDGDITKYYAGQTIYPTTNITLKPVFRANAVSLSNNSSETTVTWQLGEGNGAPTYTGEESVLVTQTTIDGVSIDLGVKLVSNNSNRHDEWTQLGMSYVPVVNNTVITYKFYVDATRPADFTVNNENFDKSSLSGNLFSYTYNGAEGEMSANMNRSYVSYIQAIYPPTAVLAMQMNPTDLIITNSYVKKQTATITLTGNELEAGKYNVQLIDAPASMSVSPTSFVVGTSGSLSQMFEITYDQQEVQAEGIATFKVLVGTEEKAIGISYGRTVAYGGTAPDVVSTKQVWDWAASNTDVKPVKEAWTSFRDVDGTWPAGLSTNYQYLEGTGEYFARGASNTQCFQGANLQFTTSLPGTLTVDFSNTGSSSRPYRYLTVNGEVLYDYKSNDANKVQSGEIRVPAGPVLIQGNFGGDSISFGPQYLRIYKMTFVPDAEVPVITLNNETSSFKLSTSDPTDKFYYTLDDSEPNEIDGILYVPNLDDNDEDQGVHLYGNAVIKAITVHTEKNNSDVAEQRTKFATYKLNATAQPKTYGYVEYIPEVSGNAYTTGSVVTLRAVAKPGYGFTGWTTDKAGNNSITTEYTTTVEIENAAQTLYAHFMQGEKGTVKYNLSGARFLPADDSYVIDDAAQDILRSDPYFASHQSLFPDIESTAIYVPSDYSLFLGSGGNTLLYWEEENNPTNRFELGTSKFFENEGDIITLVPVFKNNPGSENYYNPTSDLFDKRTGEVSVKWDFRTGFGGQAMSFAGTDANYSSLETMGVYNTNGVPYATHVTFDSQRGGKTYDDVTIDVPLLIDASEGSFNNMDIDTWAYMTEGTKIKLPSGYGAVFTLATYAPINEVGGTTINGKTPDNLFDEELRKDASGAYLYRWTITSTDLTATLRIGNDYAYYQYVKADLPAAEYKYLNVSSNNTGMGTVKIETKGVATSIGTAFTNGTSVTVSANRGRFNELKYWEDEDGNKIYPDGHYVLADNTEGNASWDGSTPFYVGSESAIRYLAISNESITFELNDYLTLQAVFGEKKNYYVDFSAGGEAEGLPPYQQHIEYDERFTMPAHNQHLYLKGYTLDYYTDELGNRYDFGQSYSVNDNIAVNGGILLSPHFKANTKSLADVTAATTVTWPMAVSYKLGSDSYPATEILYQKASGVVVDQITIGGETIDLPMYVNGMDGNVNNTSDDGFCYFYKKAVLTVPTTKGCVIKSHSTNTNFTSTTIAGATSKNSYSESGAVVTAKYTASKDPVVTYTGSASSQDIVAAEDLRLTYVSVTYQPLTDAPELTSVTVGETPFTSAQLAELKSVRSISGISATPDYANNTLCTVAATASNGGVVTITQGTPANPKATLLLQTAGGTTVATYTINFSVTGSTDPVLSAATIAGISTSTDGSTTVTGVGESGVITLTFNHAMSSATTTAAMMTASNGSEGQALKGVASTDVEAGANVYTLKFTYWSLNPGVTYTLSIPAGTLSDAAGNTYKSALTVKFTPQARDEVSKRKFDFVVTHKQAWNCETQTEGARIQTVSDEVIDNLKALNISYGTIDEATNAANAAGGTDRFYIFVPDGEYSMKGNEAGKFTSGTYNDYKWSGGVTSADARNSGKTTPGIDVTEYPGGYYNGRTFLTRSNISIVGQSQKGTILYNDPYIYGISYTSTLELRQINDCYFQDMTIDNRFSKYQVDYGNSNPGGQSVAVYDRGIHSVWKNVKMMGYQDTYASSSNRSGSANAPSYYHSYRYYEDCTVGGTVDFVCGGGDDWWERPTFIIRKRATGNNLVAPRHAHPYYSKDWLGDDYMFNEKWGYVFNNGVIVAESDAAYAAQNGKFSLGRTWQLSPACTYINTTLKIQPSEDGWTNMSSNLLCRLHEYGTKNADGTAADLTKRTIRDFSPAAGSDDCILTAEQAAEYTLHNVLGGDDAYDPTIHTKQISLAESSISNATSDGGKTILKWSENNSALCYFIFRLDEETGDTVFYSITTSAEFYPGESQADRWFVVRAANERGGLGAPSKAIQYKPLDTYEVVVTQVGPNPEMGWATVCLPQNVTFTDVEGLTVYAAIQFEGTTLRMKKVTGRDGLFQGRGYVIYAKPGKYTFRGTYGAITIQNESSTLGELSKYSVLDGNPEDHAVSIGTKNIYTLAYLEDINEEVGFYKYRESTIPARKAYLEYEKLVTAGISLDMNAKDGLRFIFDDDEWDDADADGIDGVTEDDNIDNTDDSIYDLSGKRIERSQMRKGMIYIIGGKKIRY